MSMKKTGKLLQIEDPKSDVAIKVEHVSKSFRLPHNRQSSLKGTLVNLVSGGDRTFETQEVLKDISFEIKKGEFFGIVGRNGSGKSTLLKMLAGIYTPTHGTITVNGSLTPFIELGVGFNPELTGRENVFLNGALLGFNNKDVDAMYNDIVTFAELDRFMDQKLKNYSSGMQVRLAFSIAIRSRSDILLFDEVLAVGDADFQKKCLTTFRELKKEGRTIVLVTHDMSQVEKFCDRALVLSDGNIEAVTTPREAAMIYSKLNVNLAEMEKKERKNTKDTDDRPGNGKIRISKIHLYSGEKRTKIFTTNDQLAIQMSLSDRVRSEHNLAVGLAIHSEEGLALFGPNTDELTVPVGVTGIRYTLPNLPLTQGEYSVTIMLYNKSSREQYDVLFQSVRFSVISSQLYGGKVLIDGLWNFLGDEKNV